MAFKLCWQETGSSTADITLHQAGVDRFRVTYGSQVKSNLTYAEAALELGACIMHAAACSGTLDNSERRKRS
jgi:hypothetical protein